MKVNGEFNEELTIIILKNVKNIRSFEKYFLT